MYNNQQFKNTTALATIIGLLIAGFIGSVYLYNNPHILGLKPTHTTQPKTEPCELVHTTLTTPTTRTHTYTCTDGHTRTTTSHLVNGRWEPFTP